MDYLDSKKETRQNILLMVGYFLVAIAIAIATLILLNQAAGYSINNKGKVIQNGLVFFSSHPSPANIYVEGKLNPVKTNSRLLLPSGVYKITLARSGYFDWQRTIDLPGGSVMHYDYPFLFPKTLTSKKLETYPQAPGFMSQSPDHRWLVVQKASSVRDLMVFDLKSPAKDPLDLTLPDSLISKPDSTESWQLVEWADDNQHILLEHVMGSRSEFILVDRTSPAQTVNLNTSLSINPSKLTLKNKKFDQYYVYDTPTAGLQSLTLKNPTPTPILQHVLAYKTYGSDTILYVTDNSAPAGRVLVKMMVGTNISTIRNLSANSNYLLDLAKYSNKMYVAVGATSDNRLYIFKDPIGQMATLPNVPPLVLQTLRVEGLNYLSFSSSAQFILAENDAHFGVYDIENSQAYNYQARQPLDAPQPHATWMDGDRLVYVSAGKLYVFDYDNLNPRSLMPATSSYLPAFAPDFKYVYALAANSDGQYSLNQTALVTPADL